MDLRVLADKCKFTGDGVQATITVECTDKDFARAIERLGSVECRELAIQFAAQRGMSSPAINGMLGHPYPVNSEGLPLDAVKDEHGNPLPPTDKRMQVARYRTDVPVARRG